VEGREEQFEFPNLNFLFPNLKKRKKEKES
jgi:hypothetical protein